MKFATSLIFATLIGLSTVFGQSNSACHIFAVEDTSAGGQDRGRMFVATDIDDREQAISFAQTVGQRFVDAADLDFLDVFVTRTRDGYDRDYHNSGSAVIWLRLNPGRTPVMDSEVQIEAIASNDDLALDDLLYAERRELDPSEYEDFEPAPAAAECDFDVALALYRSDG